MRSTKQRTTNVNAEGVGLDDRTLLAANAGLECLLDGRLNHARAFLLAAVSFRRDHLADIKKTHKQNAAA